MKKRGLRFIDSRHRAQQVIEARSILAEMPTTLREDILLEGEPLIGGHPLEESECVVLLKRPVLLS